MSYETTKFWLEDQARINRMIRAQKRAEAAVALLKGLVIGLLLSSPLIYQIIQQIKAGA